MTEETATPAADPAIAPWTAHAAGKHNWWTLRAPDDWVLEVAPLGAQFQYGAYSPLENWEVGEHVGTADTLADALQTLEELCADHLSAHQRAIAAARRARAALSEHPKDA